MYLFSYHHFYNLDENYFCPNAKPFLVVAIGQAAVFVAGNYIGSFYIHMYKLSSSWCKEPQSVVCS